MDVEYKRCNKCDDDKPINKFSKDRLRKDELNRFCKECIGKISKEYYYKNTEILLERVKIYNEVNIEKIKERKRKYYEKNKERMLKKNKKYYEKNKEEISEKGKEYFLNNSEKILKNNKKYRINNHEKILKQQRESYQRNKKRAAEWGKKYRKLNAEKIKEDKKKYNTTHRKQINAYIEKRMENDTVFKLNRNIANLMRQSLKHNKNGQHWENLVGYTLINLKKHLDNTMPKDYTWDDYLKGELHLDHIIPISIFNIKGIKSKGFKACWVLDNLQLLPVLENLKKGATLFYQ